LLAAKGAIGMARNYLQSVLKQRLVKEAHAEAHSCWAHRPQEGDETTARRELRSRTRRSRDCPVWTRNGAGGDATIALAAADAAAPRSGARGLKQDDARQRSW